MKAEVKLILVIILCKVNEAGITVFKDIIHQFLYYPEDQEFLLGPEALAIIMKTATCIDGASSADFLEKVVYGRF